MGIASSQNMDNALVTRWLQAQQGVGADYNPNIAALNSWLSPYLKYGTLDISRVPEIAAAIRANDPSGSAAISGGWVPGGTFAGAPINSVSGGNVNFDSTANTGDLMGNLLLGAAMSGVAGLGLGAFGPIGGMGEGALSAGVGGIDAGSLSQILGNGAYGSGSAFVPGMVDVMGGTETAMANTANQVGANVAAGGGSAGSWEGFDQIANANSGNVNNLGWEGDYANSAASSGAAGAAAGGGAAAAAPSLSNVAAGASLAGTAAAAGGGGTIDPNELAAGNPSVQNVNDLNQSTQGSSAVPTDAGGNPINTAANGVNAASAIQKLISGQSLTTADIASLASAGGTAAGGLLGYLQSNRQSDQLKSLSDQYSGYGAPSRARYEASYAPGFSMASDPGYTDALNQASKATLHSLSVNGNPAGSPNAWAQSLADNTAKFAYPALQTYRTQNANSGGISSFNSASPELATGAITAQSQGVNSLGKAAANIFNPAQPTSLADILKMYGSGGGNNIFGVAA